MAKPEMMLVNFMMPVVTKRRVEAFCKARGITMTMFIRQAVEKELDVQLIGAEKIREAVALAEKIHAKARFKSKERAEWEERVKRGKFDTVVEFKPRKVLKRT